MGKKKENWMQKYDKKRDKNFEEELNNYLNNAITEWENIMTSNEIDNTAKLKSVVEKIVKIYNNLRIEGFDYNKEDSEYFKDVLDGLKKTEEEEKKRAEDMKKYKDLEEAHKRDSDETWDQYREDEKRRDLYEIDEI